MEKQPTTRRSFIKQTALTGITAALTGKQLSAAESKSVLIVWGGWAGHEPKQCVDIFAPWLESQGCNVEISDSLDSYIDSEKNGNV